MSFTRSLKSAKLGKINFRFIFIFFGSVAQMSIVQAQIRAPRLAAKKIFLPRKIKAGFYTRRGIFSTLSG